MTGTTNGAVVGNNGSGGNYSRVRVVDSVIYSLQLVINRVAALQFFSCSSTDDDDGGGGGGDDGTRQRRRLDVVGDENNDGRVGRLQIHYVAFTDMRTLNNIGSCSSNLATQDATTCFPTEGSIEVIHSYSYEEGMEDQVQTTESLDPDDFRHAILQGSAQVDGLVNIEIISIYQHHPRVTDSNQNGGVVQSEALTSKKYVVIIAVAVTASIIAMLSMYAVLRGRNNKKLLPESPAAAQMFPMYGSDDSISMNPSTNTYASRSVIGDTPTPPSERRGGGEALYASRLYSMHDSEEEDSLSNYSSTYNYPEQAARREVSSDVSLGSSSSKNSSSGSSKLSLSSLAQQSRSSSRPSSSSAYTKSIERVENIGYNREDGNVNYLPSSVLQGLVLGHDDTDGAPYTMNQSYRPAGARRSRTS